MSLKAFFGLSENVNKVQETTEGVISDFLPELKITTGDDELIKTAKAWESIWNKHYESNLKERQKEIERYWLGLKDDEETMLTSKNKSMVDNLIFESLETFLPQATKQNPEPMVSSDSSEEGIKLAATVQKVLAYQSSMNRLGIKMINKEVLRRWAIYFFGAVQVGWDEIQNDVDIDIIRPDRLILDPEGIMKRGEYKGEFIGKWKKEKASVMVQRFPHMKKFIEKEADGKMGTMINYQEWWTDRILFWKLKDKILDKIKNPHWNYDQTVKEEVMTIDDNGNDIQDLTEDGQPRFNERTIPGANHFKVPKKPFVLFSVFNLGKHPHDDTSLIEQNIPQQDIINKRTEQIDKNIDSMNGGWIISLAKAGLSESQAGPAIKALRNGGTVAIPDGSPREAIDRLQGVSLPADVYNERQDARNELRGIFGVTGLSPQGIASEQTVRGKIITRSSDGDRIGGGISEYLELFDTKIYDWLIQLMYVYYDEEHSIPVLSDDGSQEFISLKNSDMNKTLTVAVKEGSLLPEDTLTKANQAIDLWGAGAIDPLTLFERLQFPNPKESLKKLLTWQSNPMGMVDGGQPQQEMLPGGVPAAPEVEQNVLNQVPIQ